MDDDELSRMKFISQVNNYYENLLGYSFEETKLKGLENGPWNKFCEKFNLNKNSLGIYLPRSQTAVIPIDNKLSLFHEYFGHGLYCEQNLIGRELVSLERRLIYLKKNYNLPEQSVPTNKKALTVRPSSTFGEDLNSAGAHLFLMNIKRLR